MTFIVLDANPVQSANRLCWLDCESAAFDGARIIVSAFKHHGGDITDMGFEPKEEHPLIRFALVSRENARWLMRYSRAATIKWGKEHKMENYKSLMMKMNIIASKIDVLIPQGQQQTLFGNFYIGENNQLDFTETSIESNRAYYEQTRKHLFWGDENPNKYYNGISDEE